MLILKNARVLPALTEHDSNKEVDVTISNGKIVKITPSGETPDCLEEDTVINLEGKTLLPGFIDAHVHLDCSGIDVCEENGQPNEFRILRALSLAQDGLRNGFTTIRDVGDRNNIIITLAKAAAQGYCVAPDIIATGMVITPTAMGNDYFQGMYLEADSLAEYTKAVRSQKKCGADWIKYMGTGSVMNPGGEPGLPIMTKEELKALVEAADMVEIPVCGHCHGTAGIKMAIEAGVTTIEHASILDDVCIELLKHSKKTSIVPTLAPLFYFMDHSENMPAHYVENCKKIAEHMCSGLKRASEAGIKLGFGTDAVFQGGHGNREYEFSLRCEHLGLSPLEVLIQATKYNAEILKIQDQVGIIAVGKKANLVVIDGNPDENIKLVKNVSLVVKDGKVVTI